MDQVASDALAAWLVDSGLKGAGEDDLLHGFCTRCHAAGLPVSRALTIIDTLHPVYEGRVFRWRNDGVQESTMVEFGRTTEGSAATMWQQSVFYHMLNGGEDDLHIPLAAVPETGFKQLDEMKAEGQTGFFGLVHRFNAEAIIGEMDCVYSYLCTRHPEGFTPDHLAAMRRLVPILALALKCASLARIAGTLVEVYLGRDAGRQVLRGRIQRGVADRIGAVLWFSDLRSYTAISERAPPHELLPMLNDYADAVITAVHDAGGSVLKLVGDGILATFTAEDPAEATAQAIAAEAALRTRLVDLDRDRAAQGRPTTTVYLGLHIGEVFYGNIGSEDRLDFTVIGPAVNEVNRIVTMCRSVDRTALASAEFRAATPAALRDRLVSVGRYALRGVGVAKDLYTLDLA